MKPSLWTVISEIATPGNTVIKFAMLVNNDVLSGVKLATNRNRPSNIKIATNNVISNIMPDVLKSAVNILLTLNNTSDSLLAYL